MKRLSKQTLLLWLPVVVWAATFTLLTVLFFFGNYIDVLWETAIKIILISILCINIVSASVTCVAMTLYKTKSREYLLRLLLLLSNIMTVFIYQLIINLIYH
jgi:hypothetical protein